MNWLRNLCKVWRREFRLVVSDAGVLIFFLGLPTLYPIVYTLIYNPEIVTDMPVAVVDDCRSPQSRELVRMIDATQAAKVIGYASSKSEARQWHADKRCYAVIEISEDYSRKIARGEQAPVMFYCDMSLLLRYRAMLMAFTQVQMAVDGDLRQQSIDALGSVGQVAMGSAGQVESNPLFIGDTSQGFASFVIPGIMVLILQQSLILGITMLAGGRAERRRRNGGVDPEDIPEASATATALGRMLCYLVIYIPLTLYMFMWIPAMFDLPQSGSLGEYLLFIMPMMIASSFLGISLGVFVTERESSMLVIVFTSVVFLFLSGLTWPLYAFSPFWKIVAGFVPATWGIQGFIRMISDGAAMHQQTPCYLMLWGLAALYFITSLLILRYRRAGWPRR